MPSSDAAAVTDYQVGTALCDLLSRAAWRTMGITLYRDLVGEPWSAEITEARASTDQTSAATGEQINFLAAIAEAHQVINDLPLVEERTFGIPENPEDVTRSGTLMRLFQDQAGQAENGLGLTAHYPSRGPVSHSIYCGFLDGDGAPRTASGSGETLLGAMEQLLLKLNERGAALPVEAEF